MSRPVLGRFDLVIYKDKDPPGDPAQVPHAGAIVDFYAQGATVSQSVTVPASYVGSKDSSNPVPIPAFVPAVVGEKTAPVATPAAHRSTGASVRRASPHGQAWRLEVG